MGIFKKPTLRIALLVSLLAVLLSLYIKLWLNEHKQKAPQPQQQKGTDISNLRPPGLDENSIELSDSEDYSYINESGEKQTMTEEAARALLIAYIDAKQNKKDTAELDSVLAKMSKDFLNLKIQRYIEADINIDKSGATNTAKYKQSLSRALRPLLKVKEYELETVAKIIKENDEESMKILEEDMLLYRKTIENLLKMKVPKELATPHLALINAYSKFLASLQLIKESKNDIILVYPALKYFLEADAEIYSAFDALQLYVKLHSK